MNNAVTTLNYADFEYTITTVGAFLQFDFDIPVNYGPYASRQYLNCNELKVVQRSLYSETFELCNQNFTIILNATNNTTAGGLTTRDLLLPWILQLAGSTWVSSITPPPPVYTTWSGTKRQGQTLLSTANTSYNLAFNTNVLLGSDFTSTDNITYTCLTTGGYILHLYVNNGTLQTVPNTTLWADSKFSIIRNGSLSQADLHWVNFTCPTTTSTTARIEGQITTYSQLNAGDTIKFVFLDNRSATGFVAITITQYMFMVRVTPVY